MSAHMKFSRSNWPKSVEFELDDGSTNVYEIHPFNAQDGMKLQRKVALLLENVDKIVDSNKPNIGIEDIIAMIPEMFGSIEKAGGNDFIYYLLQETLVLKKGDRERHKIVSKNVKGYDCSLFDVLFSANYGELYVVLGYIIYYNFVQPIMATVTKTGFLEEINKKEKT